jgi:hypothetical protein
MKRILLILFISILAFPTIVYGQTLKLTDTDVTLELDEDIWTILTRDNIKNKEYLDEIGLTYEYMNKVFQDNNAYLDAFTFWDDENTQTVELFVIKMKQNDPKVKNLNVYNDDEVKRIVKGIANDKKVSNYNVYKNDNSVFGYFESQDSGIYLVEYVTIINNMDYLFKFQSSYPYDERMIEVTKSIMDTVKFDYTITEEDRKNKKEIKEEKKDSFWTRVFIGGTIGAVVGGISSLIAMLIKKKSKNSF